MTRREGDWQPYCQRCGADLTTQAHTVSMFDTDVICLRCKEDERLAPGYAAAVAAEVTAVRGGDLNFPGVGLSPEDSAFLQRAREARKAAP